MGERYFIKTHELLLDSVKLAKQVVDGGFEPDIVVPLWRGGAPPGCIVHECLQYLGIKSDHTIIPASAYKGEGQIKSEIEVDIRLLADKVTAESSVLFVDDVYESGLSIKKTREELLAAVKDRFPRNNRVATVYTKSEKNQTQYTPEYSVRDFDPDVWLVFPHEFEKLTIEEITNYKGEDIGLLFSEMLSKLKRKIGR